MTAPTGNRWVNQDTGEIANPDNIQTDLPGHSKKVKYGPLVTGEGEEPTPAAPSSKPTGTAGTDVEQDGVGELTAPLPGEEGEQEVTDLPEIEGRKLGPSLEPSTAEANLAAANAQLEQAKLTIRELNRQATAPKGDKTTRKAAATALEEMAKQEYGRADGGRDPVKRILARYGYGNPNKQGG